MKRTCAVFIAMALMLCALPAFAAQSDGFTVSDVGAIDVEQFSDGYAPYYSDGLYGIVRYDGRIISEPVYQDIRAYGENLWPVQTEHGWQFVNMDGTTAIAGPFDSAGAFKYGTSVVSVNGLYGVISPSGAFVIEPIWDFIADYNELGCTCAESKGRWTIINSQGETITEFDYDSITAYDSAFIGVRGDLYDVILPDGSVAQTFMCDEIGDCSGDYVTYRIGDTWQVRTLTGESVWQLSALEDSADVFVSAPQNGYCIVYGPDASSSLYSVEHGIWITNEDWSCVNAASGGYIRAMFSDKYGYCDLSGTEQSTERWLNASDFHYGYAVVYDGLEWYVIDESFNEVKTLDGNVRSEFIDTGFTQGYIITETDAGEQIVRINGSAVEGGEFDVEDGIVTRYRGEGGDIRIPEGVTGIADEAFNGDESITSVAFPSTLTSIGARAFEGCTNLSGVISLPANVNDIGDFAFAHTSIQAFGVSDQNVVYMSWNGGLATLDGIFLCYPAGSDADYYSLPYNTVRLEQYSFAYCDSLKYLNIPGSVQDKLMISSRAFRVNDSTSIICAADTQAAQEALDHEITLLAEYATPEPTPEPTATPSPEPTIIPTDAPTPSPSPEPTGIPGKTMVYFNPNGKYYHSVSDCSGMKRAGYFTLDEAIERGKLRCPVCNPPMPTEGPSPIPTDAPAQTEFPTVIPTAEPEVTAAPEPEPTEMPTPIPTDEPTAEPTEEPTAEPEATELPTEFPTVIPTQEPAEMFSANDLFAGVLLPGKSTRNDVESVLNASADNEYAMHDETTDTDYTLVEYSFGSASYTAEGVLRDICVQNDASIETIRGITMEYTLDGVLSAFYQPSEWYDRDAGIIYSEDGFLAVCTQGDSKDHTLLSYEYDCDDELAMYLDIDFWEDSISAITMRLAPLEPAVG